MDKAYKIANHNIRACFKDGGIIASVDHYGDFWARDSFYASWGLLELGEFKKTKTNLNLYIKYQKKDGQIPRRIDRFYVALSYLGIKVKRKSLKPKYRGSYFYPALDPNILFIITCYQYAKKKDDILFLKDNFNALYTAIQWLEKYERNYLLYEEMFANWEDVIIKIGNVLYTNVLYTEALKCFFRICRMLNKSKLAKRYKQKHVVLKKKINKEFWNGNYYVDWIHKDKKYDYFSTDGNIFAMLFEISNQTQNKRIINTVEKFKLGNIPMKTNYPSYPWWRVALRRYVLGTPGYQNNFASWLWLGCVYAVSLHNHGYREKAKYVYQKISSEIEKYGVVYENYKPDGLPYTGWLWKSTTSFAWNSGLYLWMNKILYYKEKT